MTIPGGGGVSAAGPPAAGGLATTAPSAVRGARRLGALVPEVVVVSLIVTLAAAPFLAEVRFAGTGAFFEVFMIVFLFELVAMVGL